MLLFGLLGFGMIIGAIAQIVLGRDGQGIDWAMALGAGLIGSFVGGLLASLLAGDGLAFKPSGLIGSFIGAIIVTLIWRAIAQRRQRAAAATAPQHAKHGQTYKR